ncbi:hypothetical protein TNCV_4057361 [Trichonephila clavipes]|nr:hypothetical protein TNCV_4057361 [Trichonephila clavipes]
MLPINSNIRSRFTKFIVAKATPVISLRFEHHVGDSMILFGSTPILRENKHPGSDEGPPPLFPFHQPHKRTTWNVHEQCSYLSKSFIRVSSDFEEWHTDKQVATAISMIWGPNMCNYSTSNRAFFSKKKRPQKEF